MDKILIIGSGNIGYKFKNRNFYANYFDILKAKYKKKNIILFDKKDNKVFKKLSNSILKKLSKEKADNILRQIGGLLAHCQQNDVPKNEVIRLIDRIIQNS